VVALQVFLLEQQIAAHQTLVVEVVVTLIRQQALLVLVALVSLFSNIINRIQLQCQALGSSEDHHLGLRQQIQH
jgi:hypothetical protein